MRGKKATKRVTEADPVYQSRLVAKLINGIMKDGKKSVAEKQIYTALQKLGKDGKDPMEVFELAIQNVGPKVEVKARRVGGANYQVPTEVRGDRKQSLALRWIIAAAQARSNKDYHSFADKLAAEILDASQNQGTAVKKRDTVLRMAEANRAFSHFRW